MTGALVGKVRSALACTSTPHGGQVTTPVNMHTFLFHHGMVVAGVPFTPPELSTLAEISGGNPHRASSISGPRGDRTPSANEPTIARIQGRHVAQIASKRAAQ